VSFGRRLTLFFLLIVVLPMVVVAGLLLEVTRESRTGKADARLAASMDTAVRLANEAGAEAVPLARRLAGDRGLADALRSGDPQALNRAAQRLAAQPGVVAVEIAGANGQVVARAGAADAIEYAEISLKDRATTLGSLRVSTVTAAAYTSRVQALTGRDSVVADNGQVLGGTVQTNADALPGIGTTKQINVAGGDTRARSVDLGDGDVLTMFGPTASGGLPSINVGVALLLLALFGAAVAFTVFLARTLQQLHGMVSQQAVTDELTGLSNQRRFGELLAKELGRAKRFGHDLSLLMLDLDDFKAVNDTHGHLQGDDVLRAVGKAVAEQSREVDEPARYGGEEFVVALPETDLDGAVEFAERVRVSIEALDVRVRGGSGSTPITASIGVAGMSAKIEEPEALIAAADEALYEAKAAGKNRTQVAGTKRRTRRRKRAANTKRG
jgi:diguanylate cyclase (GGDEF)-like protein